MNAESAKPIFGQITYDDMRNNEQLTRTVMPLVKNACLHSKGRFTVSNVADGLVSGQLGLWGVMIPPASLECVAVTRRDGETFEVLLMGPDAEDMFPFLGALKGYARSLKCKRIRFEGPAFWRRKLPAFTRRAVVYEQSFDELPQA